jgi:hypothetical protein
LKEINKEEIARSVSSLVNEILTYMSKDKEDFEKYMDIVVKESDSIFDIISSYQERFTRDEVNSMDFYYKALDQLTGCHMYLSPIFSAAKTIIEKQHDKFCHLVKVECASKGEKYVSASTEKEADYHISDMRIRFSRFEGFLTSCLQGIQTCRCRIKSVEEERDLAK